MLAKKVKSIHETIKMCREELNQLGYHIQQAVRDIIPDLKYDVDDTRIIFRAKSRKEI